MCGLPAAGPVFFGKNCKNDGATTAERHLICLVIAPRQGVRSTAVVYLYVAARFACIIAPCSYSTKTRKVLGGQAVCGVRYVPQSVLANKKIKKSKKIITKVTPPHATQSQSLSRCVCGSLRRRSHKKDEKQVGSERSRDTRAACATHSKQHVACDDHGCLDASPSKKHATKPSQNLPSYYTISRTPAQMELAAGAEQARREQSKGKLRADALARTAARLRHAGDLVAASLGETDDDPNPNGNATPPTTNTNTTTAAAPPAAAVDNPDGEEAAALVEREAESLTALLVDTRDGVRRLRAKLAASIKRSHVERLAKHFLFFLADPTGWGAGW